MRELVSTISSKGQVTIPVDVRRRLGVDVADKIAFVFIDNDKVELRPIRYRIADLRGVVPALTGRESVDFDDQINEAFEEGADQLVQELKSR
jgi:antitoxin PrlF